MRRHAMHRYADALVEAAGHAHAIDETGEQLDAFAALLAREATLMRVLSRPYVSRARVYALLDRLCAHMAVPLLRCLKLFVRRGLMPEVFALSGAYRRKADRQANRRRGVLETPALLEDEQASAIQRVVSSRYPGETLALERRVDPRLIAGVRMTVDGMRYDFTAAGYFDAVRRRR